jgi:hypothetical protein
METRSSRVGRPSELRLKQQKTQRINESDEHIRTNLHEIGVNFVNSISKQRR